MKDSGIKSDLPTVSLCMIVKNEGKNLPRCLQSVHGLVDEMVVLDTGSEDDTVLVAESFGAKVYRIPWPGNFSVARNESLKKAGGNWILYLDADEALDPNGSPDCIRKAASDPEIDAWSVAIRNYQWETSAYDVTFNVRLFRNLPGLMFENEVHERIEPALARIDAKMAVAPFFIDHFGYELPPEEMKEKLERNLELSLKHLERDSHDPYCLYYIGANLLSLGKTAECRQYFQRALESKDIPRFLEAMTCNLLAFAELRENRPDKALLYARRSIDLVPRQNTAYMVSGAALFSKAQYSAAYPLLAGSLEFLHLSPDKRQTDLSQEHALIGDVEFHRLLGTCLSEMDRPHEAVRHFSRFMELGGRDPEVSRRAGVCCVNTGDFASALTCFEQAESLGMERTGFALPMALAAVKLKDFSRARMLMEEAEKDPQVDADKLSQIRRLLDCGLRLDDGHRPRVSLCMIARNEQDRIAGCLESVSGLVDEIIVVDTGSDDKTIEIARSLGARVFSFPWTGHFAEARNESLRHASGDWIIFLDADERLNASGVEDCLRKAASIPGLDAYVVPVINLGPNGKIESTLGRVTRFFRNMPGIHFSGRVHEGVDQFLVESGAKADHAPFEIEHFGYALEPDIVKGKYERNLRLLEEELAENPNDGNAKYHLGLTFMALEREQDARLAFDRALCCKGLSGGLKAMILNMKSYLHLRAGEVDPALEAASRSLLAAPVQNTGRLLKGLALFHKQAHGEALPLLLQAYRFISLPPKERKSDIYFEDSVDKIDLVEVIGICLAEIGRFAQAIPFLKLTATVKPGPAVFERLGICLLNCGDFSTALEYLLKAGEGAPDPNSLALPLAFASFKTGDLAAAAKYFCDFRPADESETVAAFEVIEAMAADKAFRPWLEECVRSKEKAFRQAFPERFSRFMDSHGEELVGTVNPCPAPPCTTKQGGQKRSVAHRENEN